MSSTAWENISPAVNIPYGALELDGADTPTTIYVGNDLGVLRFGQPRPDLDRPG